jgi:hypothetical protein
VLDLVGTVAPIAVSNAYKAQQMLQNGYAMDSKGRRVVDTDTGDAFSKALGFNPAVVAESGRAREEVFNQAAMLRDMKARISERWADGIAHREPEKAAEARAMLARWNENNPETPIRIDLAAVLRRARLARMTRRDALSKRRRRSFGGLPSRCWSRIEALPPGCVTGAVTGNGWCGVTGGVTAGVTTCHP